MSTVDTRDIASPGAPLMLTTFETIFRSALVPSNSGDVEKGVALLNEIADLMREMHL
jgi:hypothetical protein